MVRKRVGVSQVVRKSKEIGKVRRGEDEGRDREKREKGGGARRSVVSLMRMCV